ncbi:hypothetical protein N7474_005814 [Penicillium riverlandense]|uniref:uncharacterized protein n=1 Tax=Penicillium riverlandense TaxID=1903569 RepID=UPI0025471C9F|nr:uncharacterized protein N7474_005814 [Penicillium riverlandense]KAJ5820223.1 hypothetical protein N7474_005814 [Penicillium riverlandense]
MQVAEILSDITSLRVCGDKEALTLVNVHTTIPSAESAGAGKAGIESASLGAGQLSKKEKDLHRVKELVELHYEMKARHVNGQVDEDLRRARENVREVLGDLETIV